MTAHVIALYNLTTAALPPPMHGRADICGRGVNFQPIGEMTSRTCIVRFSGHQAVDVKASLSLHGRYVYGIGFPSVGLNH